MSRITNILPPFLSSILYFMSAFVAGAILPLAFAPKGFYLLAIISPLLLLYLLENALPKTAFWRGFLYGLGFFGFGAYWIFISINTFGNTNVFISSFITFGFICILALFLAAAAYMYARASKVTPSIKDCILFSCIWVIFEWIRSWFCTGFPWLLLGQSQTNSFLHGYAPIIGVYGISFLAVFTSTLLYKIIKNYQTLLTVIINSILIFVIWFGGYALSFVQWTHPISDPFSVTLIQGNIPEMMKWDPQLAYKSLQNYVNLTAKHLDSKIIIWPETAVTPLYSDAKPILDNISQTTRKHHATIITGIPVDQNDKYYNGAIVLGNGSGIYFKRHLVPFGEYVPLENYLRGIIGAFNLPMSDFSNGPEKQHLLHAQNLNIGMFICYEIAYSHLLRTDLPRANILVTISNDSWFGQSEALAQHLQITQISAEMAQRYMLVATNSGITAVISPEGKILASAPIDETAFITAFVQAMDGATPWVRYGNGPILILIGLGLILCWIRR